MWPLTVLALTLALPLPQIKHDRQQVSRFGWS
jgi:hypothetical protein